MKKKMLTGLAAGLFVIGLTAMAEAAPLDLSSWSEYTYALGGQPAGNWVLSNFDTTVTQTINADPSMYLDNANHASYKMDGNWRTATSSDDDYIGFVFGYQDPSHFYIMDWKQSRQNEGGAYGFADEGFRILKIAADSSGDLVLRDFWESGTTHSTVLASNSGNDKGWEDYVSYKFHLDFVPGTFSILVSSQADTELWNVTVNDSSCTNGQFGFYNFSQKQVEYSGFEETPVPLPPAIFLFGTGLAGLAGIRFKRKKQ